MCRELTWRILTFESKRDEHRQVLLNRLPGLDRKLLKDGKRAEERKLFSAVGGFSCRKPSRGS